ncbi:DUF2268 domain-containing protein [Domibacillus robiginosus]|uniref:DUF2268 domain-containing protein n=1 Tax=Domibacillus robiginosus TaxID=1071054 RepID=UPI00067AAA6A|nr:DUF2268 domain-containing putative Zn-dependent protease [Domibacillus robiginosus]
MPVLNSRIWLDQFAKECEKSGGKNAYFIQCQELCTPIQPFFPALSREELHYHLLASGLFEPAQWRETRQKVHEMEKSGLWVLVNHEYKELRKKWRGPEVEIVLFPVRTVRSQRKKTDIKKNGIAVGNVIFLFLTPGLQREEVKALLAHEYSHVCRLFHMKKEDEALNLKEVLVLEGLGEIAVKKLYGEKWLAPWTGFYTPERRMAVWEKMFVPALELVGRDQYDRFLYGNKQEGIPKWMGYCIGFHLVDSFDRRCGPFDINELLHKTAHEIVAGSAFHL